MSQSAVVGATCIFGYSHQILLILMSGFGDIRTVKAEKFATRWVANIWPPTGRSVDSALKEKNGVEEIKIKPPASFEDVFKERRNYHEAVWLTLNSNSVHINVPTGEALVPRRVPAPDDETTRDVGVPENS